VTQGPRRKPGASSYTPTRLSLSRDVRPQRVRLLQKHVPCEHAILRGEWTHQTRYIVEGYLDCASTKVWCVHSPRKTSVQATLQRQAGGPSETLNPKCQNQLKNQGEIREKSGHMIEKWFQTFSRIIDGRSGRKTLIRCGRERRDLKLSVGSGIEYVV